MPLAPSNPDRALYREKAEEGDSHLAISEMSSGQLKTAKVDERSEG